MYDSVVNHRHSINRTASSESNDLQQTQPHQSLQLTNAKFQSPNNIHTHYILRLFLGWHPLTFTSFMAQIQRFADDSRSSLDAIAMAPKANLPVTNIASARSTTSTASINHQDEKVQVPPPACSTVCSELQLYNNTNSNVESRFNHYHNNRKLRAIRSLSREDLLKEFEDISVASSTEDDSSRDSSTTQIHHRRRRSFLRKSSKGWNTSMLVNADANDGGNGVDANKMSYDSLLHTNYVRFPISPKGSLEGTQVYIDIKDIHSIDMDNDDGSVSSLSSGAGSYDGDDEHDFSMETDDIETSFDHSPDGSGLQYQNENRIALIEMNIPGLKVTPGTKMSSDQCKPVQPQPSCVPTSTVSFNCLPNKCMICETTFFIGGKVNHCNACGTYFHSSCLGDWLQRRDNCPSCLAALLPC